MPKSIHKEKQTSFHPLLRELKLWVPASTSKNGTSAKVSNATTRATPLEVLNQLLQESRIPEELLRSTVKTIEDQKKAEQEKCQPSSLQQPPEHRTRHIALRFLYDGAKYSGLAQNLGQESDNSVEKALFQALIKSRLVQTRETSGYSRCGRTDRGVSAAGQVVALNLKSAIPMDASWDEHGESLVSPQNENAANDNERLPRNDFETISVWVHPRKKGKSIDPTLDDSSRVHNMLSEYPYAKILNNLLPPEIRVLGWAPVSEQFSARFSATTRTYRYFFTKRQLNLSRIHGGLQLLKGRHDFRNFCKMDVEKVYNFERVIYDAKLFINIPSSSQTPIEFTGPTTDTSSMTSRDTCYVQIHGQAFLWHQIRCIMEVLFMIGNGLESPSIITELVDISKYPGKPAYNLAPEKPLVLNDCGYPNLRVGYSVQNVWAVSCQLEQQWEELVLAAARIQNGIEGFRDVEVLKEDLLNFATMKVAERIKKQTKMALTTTHKAVELSVDMFDNGKSTVDWKDALIWLKDYDLVPDSNGLNASIHIPLLRRSMGTTYEQKVEALKKSTKRRQKYEENIVKKRKSAEEDAAFYAHMSKQGGKGM